MKCPNCGHDVPDGYWRCPSCKNHVDGNNNSIIETTTDDEDRQHSRTRRRASSFIRYFEVQDVKFVLLSLSTFGIYEIYWFYQNWKQFKSRVDNGISPFWRAVFSIFFCHGLFKKILDDSKSRGYKGSYSPVLFLLLLIALQTSVKLPDPFWMICYVTFIPFLPVQKAIRYYNSEMDPEYTRESTYSVYEVLIIIVGGVLFSFTAITTLLEAVNIL